MKKWWLAVLSASFALAGAVALASCDSVEEKLSCELIEGTQTYRVVGIGTVKNRDVVIPDEIDGIPVVELGDNVFAGGNIKSVKIPDSVKKIGVGTFYNCDELTSVTLGDGLETIGASAFQGCDNLTEVSLPASLKKIENAAFAESALTALVLPDKVTTVGSTAFAYCEDMLSATLNNNLLLLGEASFRGCTNLQSVTLSENISTIEAYTFFDCHNLTSVVIPESVTEIKDTAFVSCYKLIEVCSQSEDVVVERGSLGNGQIGYYAYAVYNQPAAFATKVSVVDDYAVYMDGTAKFILGYVGSATDITLPTDTYSVRNHAFYKEKGIRSVVIPEGAEELGQSAFFGCENLRTISIPSSLKVVGTGAFDGCSKLQYTEKNGLQYLGNSDNLYLYLKGVTTKTVDAISIHSACKFIGDSAFLNCKSLTTVVIPDNVKTIGYGAFSSCTALLEVQIGTGVYEIGNSAFHNCTALASIYIPSNVIFMGSQIFSSCDEQMTISCGTTTKPTGWANDWHASITNITWGN